MRELTANVAVMVTLVFTMVVSNAEVLPSKSAVVKTSLPNVDLHDALRSLSLISALPLDSPRSRRFFRFDDYVLSRNLQQIRGGASPSSSYDEDDEVSSTDEGGEEPTDKISLNAALNEGPHPGLPQKVGMFLLKSSYRAISTITKFTFSTIGSVARKSTSISNFMDDLTGSGGKGDDFLKWLDTKYGSGDR